MIYNIKEKPYGNSENNIKKYKMHKLGEFLCPYGITGVEPFMNGYLLASGGRSLYQLKINNEPRQYFIKIIFHPTGLFWGLALF